MGDHVSDSNKVIGERWYPVGEVSVESMRERSAFTALPPHYALHVWFARRPLIVSRAAITAALLSSDVDTEKFLHLNGIPANINVLNVYNGFLRAKAEKKKIVNPFSWERAFTYTPTKEDLTAFHADIQRDNSDTKPIVFDPFAGGGSIPLEAIRLGLDVVANDLNPVAFTCLKGTLEYPAKFGKRLLPAIDLFCKNIHIAASRLLAPYFPKPNGIDVYAYLWARTVRCPRCGFTVPLSPNWWLVRNASEKIAIRPIVDRSANACQFEVIKNPKMHGLDPDHGTTSGGDASCLSCGSTIDGGFIKVEAQSGRMGHQLYTVCTKEPKSRGRGKAWCFREPTIEDLAAVEMAEACARQHIQEWITNGLIPSETFSDNVNDTRPIEYGMAHWHNLFSPRQILTHATYMKAFQEEKAALFAGLQEGTADFEFARAVAVYGAIVFDTCVDYNSLLALWHPSRSVIYHTMAIQAFPFKMSYAEWNQIVDGAGFTWAVTKTLKTLRAIIDLLPLEPGNPIITHRLAQASKLSTGSVDTIVTDPPYVGNVMYAEISDFFYVWLRLLIGDLYPEVFNEPLTNKIDEAVANPARFAGFKRGQAKVLATQDYAAKMEASFRECHRVLRDNGILCVMFTHRTQKAWQDLAESLMNAGFTLRTSWPVRTEPGQKFGKADKVECTPDGRQVVKREYLKPSPFQTDQVICIRELNAVFSCCKPSR